MALEHRSDEGTVPAAKISDLIAALEKIKEASGDLELAKARYDGTVEDWVFEPIWISEAADFLDIVEVLDKPIGYDVYQYDKPVRIFDSIVGNFLVIGGT